MKVYYKQGFGVFFTLCGIILVILNLWLLSLGAGRGFQLVICVFLTVIGILYFTQPYFELRANEIVLFNKFGMELKNYTFDNLSQLHVLNDKVYLNKDEKSIKLKLSKMMSRPAEWDAFIRAITDGDLTNELHNI